MALNDLKPSIQALHAEKSRAYGNAWKKRGEVLGVLANLARKIDRLEVLQGDPQAAASESILDTAVDLLVYALKYQTFLADLEPRVARQLFPDSIAPPYSDGTAGFDYLLHHLSSRPARSQQEAVNTVIQQFQALESGFEGLQENSGVLMRANEAGKLAQLAGALVSTLSTPASEAVKNLRQRTGV